MEDSQLSYSVLITTYNSSDFIAKALDSVFAQSIKPRQVVLVDDCSSDDTIEQVSKYQIDIVKTPINSGTSIARDAGLALITSGITFLLDADDCWDDGHAEQHLQVWKTSSTKVAAVGSKMRISFHDSVPSSQQYIYESRMADWTHLGVLELAARNPMFSSATSFRTSVLEEMGGWSFAGQKYCEDYWVLTELLVNGYEVKKILQNTGTYLISEVNKSSNLIEVFRSESLAMKRLLEYYKVSDTLKSLDEKRITYHKYLSQLTRIFRRLTFPEIFTSTIFDHLVVLHRTTLVRALNLKFCRVSLYLMWRLYLTMRGLKNCERD